MNFNVWTEEEDAILREHYAEPLAFIHLLLQNRTKIAVQNRLHRLHLKRKCGVCKFCGVQIPFNGTGRPPERCFLHPYPKHPPKNFSSIIHRKDYMRRYRTAIKIEKHGIPQILYAGRPDDASAPPTFIVKNGYVYDVRLDVRTKLMREADKR